MFEPIRILTVIGTRPEAIKLAPVISELGRSPAKTQSFVCSTGQHRQMLDQVFSVFGIRPDYELSVMTHNQSLASLTASILDGLDKVVDSIKPHWILAQGDTTTAMVAGLIAYYRNIKFGHIEAGLRTKDKRSPFPEEMNRRIADLLADLYFAPTERARTALLTEGVAEESIRVTGNTVVDALLEVAERPYNWNAGPLRTLSASSRFVLITAHRRESFGKPFQDLCEAIRLLAIEFANSGINFVYPVHLNPNVQDPVKRILSGLPNLHLIPPLEYVDFVHLMKRSSLVLTDSGGIQEEAPSFGVPVLVMRDKTERPEGIEAGVAKLVGTTPAAIVRESTKCLRSPSLKPVKNPYGDGKAAERIVSAIIEFR